MAVEGPEDGTEVATTQGPQRDLQQVSDFQEVKDEVAGHLGSS